MSHTGLCIGGPLAGRTLTAPHDRYMIDVTKPATDKTPAGSVQPLPERVVYRYEVMQADDSDDKDPVEFGFWLPEGMTFADATRCLIDGYVSTTAMRG